MPVMMTAEVPGQTPDGYDGLRAHLTLLQQAPGFILHTSYATDDGWRVMEIWASKHDANQFFTQHVHPNLPPGIRPRRTFQELHSLIGQP